MDSCKDAPPWVQSPEMLLRYLQMFLECSVLFWCLFVSRWNLKVALNSLCSPSLYWTCSNPPASPSKYWNYKHESPHSALWFSFHLFFLNNKVFLCSPGWPQTHNSPASASWGPPGHYHIQPYNGILNHHSQLCSRISFASHRLNTSVTQQEHKKEEWQTQNKKSKFFF